jgi:Tol biopolymer transport system component
VLRAALLVAAGLVLVTGPAASAPGLGDSRLEGRIAFATRFWPKDPRIVDNWEIFVQRPGEPSVNLTRNPGCSEFFPAWARSGRWLAFVCGYGPAAGVYLMRDDRSIRRRVFRGRRQERFDKRGPAWSADDRRVAFARTTGIWVVDVDGSDLRQISRGPHSSPTWSADSRWIAYERGRHIFKMRDNGTRDRLIAGDASEPAWSPDGRTIAFLKQRSVWLMDPDGGNVRRIPGTRGVDPTDVAWSPNSRYLAYEVSCCKEAGVYVTALDGRDRQRLSFVPDIDGISWGPARPARGSQPT